MRVMAGVSVALLTAVPSAGTARVAAPPELAIAYPSGWSPGGRDFATISPNGDGHRDRALIRFRVREPARVTIAVAAQGHRQRKVFDRTLRVRAGTHYLWWRPRVTLAARTYVVRMTVRTRSATRRVGFRPQDRAPVVRVLGIEAGFERESYAPGTVARLRIETDERDLTLQLFRVGGAERALAGGRYEGESVAAPVVLPLGPSRRAARTVRVWVDAWPSGLYVARLSTSDGRVGYAPFVVRPPAPGRHRVAIVLPTYTWQAYNFRDENGDGVGDTWYDGFHTNRTRLGRPYMAPGMPPFFRSYDWNFLAWLDRRERRAGTTIADFLADGDLERVGSAVGLARSYDLIVFPGHHEYVTSRAYRLVREFRNRGGNLMFLSANNFFWRVDRRGRTLTRVRTWRQLGQPESALLGVQYFANDRGARRGPFVVRSSPASDWVFEGTGLAPGMTFGSFGIEIDHKTRRSPRGTMVLAEIPNLFGRGKTAQMTYYETSKSARVFSAGAFTLAGWAMYEPVSRILDNLWDRMSKP